MRDCPDGELRDLLPLYSAGRLSAGAQERVAAHVASCVECAAELDLLGSVARAYPAPQLDVAAIARNMPVRRRQKAAPFHRQPLWRVAATMTLMIAATATYTAIRSGRIAEPTTDTLTLADGGVRVAATDTGNEPAAATATHGIGLGVSLNNLTDAQLETLIASLDGLEGNVLADPELISKPIVSPSMDEDGRNP
jgi:anti-sigma factor RsiW